MNTFSSVNLILSVADNRNAPSVISESTLSYEILYSEHLLLHEQKSSNVLMSLKLYKKGQGGSGSRQIFITMIYLATTGWNVFVSGPLVSVKVASASPCPANYLGISAHF